MHALYQRLKELDFDTFQKLVYHLLKERHPGIEIRHVEGTGGDQGVDCFSGELDGDSVIWQVKSFPNGIGNSQKAQIRESLRQVLKHSRPRMWILCVSTDLNTKAHRWFQRLRQSYASLLSIGLLDASRIVHELIYRRAIREAFIPHAVLDSIELRQALAKTGELSTEELTALTADNVDRYLDRLQARDARFTYQVMFSGNGKPTVSDGLPGLLATVSDGDKVVQVFPRDTEALSLNPLSASVSIQGTGVQKLEDFIRTGKPQDFSADELLTFSSDLAFLFPASGQFAPGSLRMHIGPPTAGRLRLPLRVTFDGGDRVVVYEHLAFEVARTGTEEIELVTVAKRPFSISMVFGPPNLASGKVSFSFTFADADLDAIAKIMSAIDALRTGGNLELYNLETSSRLTRARIATETVYEWDTELRELVSASLAVSKHFGVQIRYRKPETADFQALADLFGLMNGLSCEAASLKIQLTKVGEPDPELYDKMRNASTYRIVTPDIDPPPVLFGTPVATGPVVWDIPAATVKNADATYQRISEAAIGDQFEVTLNLLAPVQVRAEGKGAAALEEDHRTPPGNPLQVDP